MNNAYLSSRYKITLRHLQIFAFVLIIWIGLFGCRVALFMPQKITQAKEMWNSKKLSHYEVVVFAEFAEIKMEIRDNRVVNAMWRGALRPDQPFDSLDQQEIVSRNFQKYTIDGLFQQISSLTGKIGIIDINGRILLDFDTEFGFPSRIEINDCGYYGGLIAPAIGDCGWGIRVKSLKTLD